MAKNYYALFYLVYSYDILNETKVYSIFIQQMKIAFLDIDGVPDAENQCFGDTTCRSVVNKLQYDNELSKKAKISLYILEVHPGWILILQGSEAFGIVNYYKEFRS
jgi:hypothetical protein